MKKALVLLLVLSTLAAGIETHKDITIGTVVTNGIGDAYWDYWLMDYGWDKVNYYIGYYYDFTLEYDDRTLINFDLSAVDHDEVKVKKVEIDIDTDIDYTYYVKWLTTLRTNAVAASTVHDEIVAATPYITNKATNVFHDLGGNAITQASVWLHSGQNAFAVGISDEGDDNSQLITDYDLRITYYYPPDELDTWQINEVYPIGYAAGRGVGSAPFNGDIDITGSGDLQVNGDTDLNCNVVAGCDLTIAAGGGLTMEAGSILRL